MEMKLTIDKQLDIYAQRIIDKHGKGYVIRTADVKIALMKEFGTNPNSVLLADYCYNRYNNGIGFDHTAFFEFVGRGKYKVWGKNYPYNGLITADPKGEQEHIVGKCVNGKFVKYFQ